MAILFNTIQNCHQSIDFQGLNKERAPSSYGSTLLLKIHDLAHQFLGFITDSSRGSSEWLVRKDADQLATKISKTFTGTLALQQKSVTDLKALYKGLNNIQKSINFSSENGLAMKSVITMVDSTLKTKKAEQRKSKQDRKEAKKQIGVHKTRQLSESELKRLHKLWDTNPSIQGDTTRYNWFSQNIRFLKRSYCQSSVGEEHGNLGTGVCYHNCIARYQQLLQDPTIKTTSIQMGSSPDTRARQARHLAKHRHGERPNPNEHLKGYGLQLYYEQNKSENSSPNETLASSIQSLYNTGWDQILLIVYSSESPGHAINIQFNRETGTYRLFDDNFGVFEFESFDVLKEKLDEYCKLFYPGWTNYRFEAFEPLPESKAR